MKIILASKSPRRKKLLQDAGYEIEIDVSGFDEELVEETEPHKLVMAIAKGKALTVAMNHKNSIVIAADTMVSKNGELIGQQQNDKAAELTMRKLLGTSHEVYTGICVINTGTGKILQDSEMSVVHIKNVAESDLKAYISSDQYKGKAGAYNIADPEFAIFVDHVDGSYTNVLGLPMEKVRLLIEKALEK